MSLPAELRVTYSGWYGSLMISTALLIFRLHQERLSLTNVINLRQKAFVICFNTIIFVEVLPVESPNMAAFTFPVLTLMSNGCSTLDEIAFGSPCVDQLYFLLRQGQRLLAIWRQPG